MLCKLESLNRECASRFFLSQGEPFKEIGMSNWKSMLHLARCPASTESYSRAMTCLTIGVDRNGVLHTVIVTRYRKFYDAPQVAGEGAHWRFHTLSSFGFAVAGVFSPGGTRRPPKKELRANHFKISSVTLWRRCLSQCHGMSV